MAGKVVIQLVKQVFDVFVFNNFFHHDAMHYDCVLSQARVILSGSGCFFCTVLVKHLRKGPLRRSPLKQLHCFPRLKLVLCATSNPT